jgi:phytoene dehydrogenase-like protein
MPDYDAIMIGANNHTLAAAGYLGKELGYKCLILERRQFPGAAAMTKEVVPGFRFHCAATGYANYINQELIRDLELDKYGVEMIRLDPWLTSMYPDGKYVSVFEDIEATCRDFARFSKKDAEAFRMFMEKWRKLTELMGPAMQGPPVPFTTLAGAMAMGPEMEEMLRDMVFMSLRRSLDGMYENDYIKCAYLSWLEGTTYPPSAPGTLFSIVGHLVVNLQWTVNKGGLGVISKALAKSAEHFGATIKLGTNVKKILVKNGKAVGVKLTSGEEITASMVLSGAEPQVTFLDMIGEDSFEPDFVRRVKSIWYEAVGCTLSFALSELPDFKVPRDRLKGFIGFSPSYEYCEKAYYQRIIGEIPDNPIMIGFVLSEIDPTMAPAGKHLLTVYVFPLPYRLKKGNWETQKEELFEKTLNTLAMFAPNIKKSVIGKGGFTPLELEREFGMTNGDHQHGSIEWGNLLGFRPIIGWSEPYKTPIANLYLCSAAVQATGISGVVGHNIANMIIEDAKKGKKGKK